MKKLPLLLAASLLLLLSLPAIAATPNPTPPPSPASSPAASSASSAKPAPAPADDAIVMKPFVIAAANVQVHIEWLTSRKDKIDRVLYMQVNTLSERSTAYAAGLRKDMVIDAIDGKRVEDATREELAKILGRPPRKDGYLVLTVLQGLDKKKIRVPNEATVDVKPYK
jgi:SpoVK/Ycf46/Vps4 family AAA+-type ATPase